jgi:hypothetical protein
MAIDAGPAMAGYMLKDRHDSAVEQPCTNGSGEARNPFRIAPISPVADHRIRGGRRDVKDRQATNGDS